MFTVSYGTLRVLSTCTHVFENPHCGNILVPFMNRTTLLALKYLSIASFNSGVIPEFSYPTTPHPTSKSTCDHVCLALVPTSAHTQNLEKNMTLVYGTYRKGETILFQRARGQKQKPWIERLGSPNLQAPGSGAQTIPGAYEPRKIMHNKTLSTNESHAEEKP
jgi:hypothetical protein